ncbi:hypothetical protein EYF80_000259 [Liparis tanakae]|uniref:Uncharacterized protein n=1 Tax=Liparis tanakae TaxID=230148 RepID=A0A4Z2JH80_9TELE|nr:hypothetical protein EYF80_000259 [Liparis tanakae]
MPLLFSAGSLGGGCFAGGDVGRGEYGYDGGSPRCSLADVLGGEGGERSVPGKLAERCSTRASWLTDLWAEFIAEMARHKISPSGMNCDWLIGDMLIGDTSPAGWGRGRRRRRRRHNC